MFQGPGVHAMTGVGDCQPGVLDGTEIRVCPDPWLVRAKGLQFQREPSLQAFHGVERVGAQVDRRLVNLGRIG